MTQKNKSSYGVDPLESSLGTALDGSSAVEHGPQAAQRDGWGVVASFKCKPASSDIRDIEDLRKAFKASTDRLMEDSDVLVSRSDVDADGNAGSLSIEIVPSARRAAVVDIAASAALSTTSVVEDFCGFAQVDEVFLVGAWDESTDSIGVLGITDAVRTAVADKRRFGEELNIGLSPGSSE